MEAPGETGRANFKGSEVMADHPRFEIRFLGTLVRAEGIAGIVGAITIVGIVLAAYFGN
jgi:hypothetical protein